MSLALVSEVWKLLKPSLEAGTVADEAADTLVNYLIDEDYSPNEIKQAFRGDGFIKDALEFFLETPDEGFKIDEEIDDPYEDDYSFDDEDDDWN
jgi:hypothetical protein